MPTQTEREAFSAATGVPRGTLAKLDRYAELLVEWNQKFNLVAKSTMPHIWTRHFLDSAQVYPRLLCAHDTRDARGGRNRDCGGLTLADLGSGAGFPGLVLAIMGDAKVHLIESIGKKANFLRAVVDELKLDTIVHQERAESLKGLQADIITARALGGLADLFKLSQPIAKPETIYLFLKGQNVDSELTEAKKNWTFDADKTPSLSDPSGAVLTVRNLKYKHARRPRR